MNHNISTGGIAAVEPSHAEPPIIMASDRVWLPELIESDWEYESRFISNKGLSGKFGLSTRCEPQSTSEGGNDKSSECCKTYSVAFYEKARTSNVFDDDGSVTGWIVFGGGIGSGILLVAYAALKKRR